jgi:Flp pilus assembly pilin Flp
MRLLSQFLRDERGVTAIELGLIIVLFCGAMCGLALFAGIMYRLVFGF